MTVLNAAQVAQLVKQAGFPANVHVEMVAISKAESSFRTDAIGGPNKNQTFDRGLWQINDVHRFDRNRLVRDGKYNAECAKNVFDRQGLRAWSVYNSGAWRKHENEARQGVAQSSSVVGNPEVTGSAEQGKPAVTYGPPGPQLTVAGVGTPLAAGGVVPGPLQGLRIIGTELEGDFSNVVIENSRYTAGWDTVPNLTFTVADPEGGMLWFHRGIWQRGVRVTWRDLDMRIDEITFSPGGHTTGQLEVSAIDSIVYGLMNLRGERVASNVSAVQWLAQELALCGFDPNRYLLGEAVPTQSEIARDIPDPEGQAGNSEAPSAWTTIVRLAKELGKRVFISGARIVFGSAAFAMQWSAPGDLHIGWHSMQPGERWHTLPTGKQTSTGNRSGLTEVSGRVPLNRAQFFRPGVSVLVRHTPSIAAAENRPFMVSKIEHDLANDIDGADVTLNEPVDPPPQPPTSNENVNNGNTGNGEQVSGGGADGQVDQFVNLCLRQVGDRYVFGAETRMDDPDPKVFDCCIVGGMRVHTTGRGLVQIEKIAIGDMVWGCDRNADNALAARPVIAWSRQRPRPIHRIRAGHHEIDVTGNHPFLRVARLACKHDGEDGPREKTRWMSEWVNAERLAPGDLLVTFDEAILHLNPPRRELTLLNDYGLRRFLPEPWSVCQVQSAQVVGEDETFDIQVEGTHNFIAEGLLVSNSELIEWAASRVGISPRVPDGSSAQINHCRSIPVDQAIRTKGALLWHSGHIAVSLGNGKTVEAQNSRVGVVQSSAGNRFRRGGLIPGARGYR